MGRDLTAGMQTDLTAAQLRPVLFYEGEFPSGTLRLWTGVGTIQWNGETWNGAGTLFGFDQISEPTEIRASGVRLSLNGLDSTIVALVLSEARQGRPGRVWLGTIDGGGTVTSDPYLAFEGRLDTPEIVSDGTQALVSITYESRLVDLERARIRRITHEDLQIDHPGDMGREFVAGLQDKVFIF